MLKRNEIHVINSHCLGNLFHFIHYVAKQGERGRSPKPEVQKLKLANDKCQRLNSACILSAEQRICYCSVKSCTHHDCPPVWKIILIILLCLIFWIFYFHFTHFFPSKTDTCMFNSECLITFSYLKS